MRVNQTTDNLPEVIEFYRDGLGLSVLGSFEDLDGYRVVLVQDTWK